MPSTQRRTTVLSTTPRKAARALGYPVAVTDYQVTRRQRVHLLYLPNDRYHFVAHTLLELVQEAKRHDYDRLALAADPYERNPCAQVLRFEGETPLIVDPSQDPDLD